MRDNYEWKLWAFYSNIYSFNLYGDPSLGLNNEKIDANPPSINIDKPEKALYFNNKKILPLPFLKPIIIGSIMVEVDTQDSSGIEKIEFYLDGVFKEVDTSKPYTWMLDEKIYGAHTLMVVVYDKNGNIAGRELQMWIFNL